MTVSKVSLLTVAGSLLLSGCASEGLASLPLPHPGTSGQGYTITAEFSDALNLPAFAKVRLGGADVGQMESISARNYTAVATLWIQDGVRLPKGTTAELRSATPLGDVFVSVKPPTTVDPNAPMLKQGDNIALKDTAAAATVENLLTGAAVLVNGGAVQNLTNLLNGAGKAVGTNGGGNFRGLVDNTTTLLTTMNSRTDQLSTSLTELSALSDRLNEKNQVIDELMGAAGPATNTLSQQTNQIADLIVQTGATTQMLAKFPSIGGTDTSGRSVIKDLNTISGSFNDVVQDPDARLASLNRLMPPIIKATSSDAISVRGSIDRLILGSIPDIGYLGDIGLHGPKWSTWNQLVGSFKYTLFRLQERIVGRGPDVPQVPVIPSPADPGQWSVLGPPPGPTAPGEFVAPPGSPASPAPVTPAPVTPAPVTAP